MGNTVPKAMAIHDLAGYGRCSLSVILPVLSVLGVQACPVPTAVLSTHTGGFQGFSFLDLTDEMESFRTHWKGLSLSFDCIYSGFLGSARQISIVESLFHDFKKKPDGLVFVDPVMGDDGHRYRTYTDEMQARMRTLVAAADIITPNLTEACFLLDETYPGDELPIADAQRMLLKLAGMGPNIVVITGLKESGAEGFNIAYDGGSDQFWLTGYRHFPVRYPGTGDIFASVLLGGLLKGDSLPTALDRATQYLSLTVGITHGCGSDVRDGVQFERTLSFLAEQLRTSTVREIRG